MKQMCGLIAKAQREVEELDQKYPELREKYFKKYMDARKQAGLPTDQKSVEDSFVKYLVEDVNIKAITDEYDRLYSSED